MKTINKLLIAFLLLFAGTVTAQQTDIKNYSVKRYADDVILLKSWGELYNGVSHKIYQVQVLYAGTYYFNSLSNAIKDMNWDVYIDDAYWSTIKPTRHGWQYIGNTVPGHYLAPGRHELRFIGRTTAVPMIEEIFMSRTPYAARVNPATDAFIQKMDQQEILRNSGAPAVMGEEAAKVLANPEGNYTHAVDTAFSYTHYSNIYLNPGTYSFATYGSTAPGTLTIFNIANLSHSWANAFGSGGNEAYLNINVTLAGYYAIMMRSVNDGQTGSTNIQMGATTIVYNAAIGGKRLGMSTARNGALNFFTCRLGGSSPDTRMLVTKYSGSSAIAYNDDYTGGGGDWAWGYASRIKKTFTAGTEDVQYAFICAFSPGTAGICDAYLACQNSNVYNTNYPEFPLLKADDAIMAANTGYYNCISWSGGVTSAWIWPPSAYSTYNCANTGSNYSDITCFDNFYANSPVRYPGAWNYTRSGATSANATVDVWKLGITYTHGSVRKPGNDHPHGYDWESKPGGLTRTFHPRNALTNNSFGYGAVSDYYRSTGTFARTAGVTKAIESDMDAVNAGLAVIENATLSFAAQQKLRGMIMKTDRNVESRLNELYKAWDATKAANAMYSDPAMYCKNPEFAALAAYAQKHQREAMIFTFDKFVNANDHMIGELMWTLTKTQYGRLLDEVKAERMAKPNDDQGRYKVHGDHDNGVLYVEKILKGMNDVADVQAPVEAVTVTASPNPVKDWLTVKLNVAVNSMVSVKATSAQTRAVKVLQAEKQLAAGNYQFTLNTMGFAGSTGDIITVQVTINGEMNTVKVMVAK